MSTPTAIVTGAGGAIATSFRQTLGEAGWKLGLVAFDQAEETRLRSAHPGFPVATGNLADSKAAQEVMGKLISELGSVDALFNVAGGFAMTDAIDTSDADLAAQFDINFHTAFHATRAVLPTMLSAGSGFVLGVGAAAAIDGGAGMGAYAASKAALVAWLKSLRGEVATKGVDVAILYPMAAVDTAGNRAAMPDADPASWIDPAELAATALHLATRSPRGRMFEAQVFPPA